MQKIIKIVRAVSEKTALPTNQPNMKVSDIGLIWRCFHEYLQIKNFFQKSGFVTFLLLQSPNLMQKIRKILRAVSEKTALPTNQPIITNNTDLIGPHMLWSKKLPNILELDLKNVNNYAICCNIQSKIKLWMNRDNKLPSWHNNLNLEV